MKVLEKIKAVYDFVKAIRKSKAIFYTFTFEEGTMYKVDICSYGFNLEYSKKLHQEYKKIFNKS